MKRKHLAKHQPAFTLIEILIVTIMLGIISISMAVSFSGSRTKVEFQDLEVKVINMIQEARSLGLANLLVNEESAEQTDYYLLTIEQDQLTLEAIGVEGNSLPIETLTLSEGYEITFRGSINELEILYSPPYGDIAFGNGQSTNFFTLAAKDGSYETEYSISIFGGFPEEVD